MLKSIHNILNKTKKTITNWTQYKSIKQSILLLIFFSFLYIILITLIFLPTLLITEILINIFTTLKLTILNNITRMLYLILIWSFTGIYIIIFYTLLPLKWLLDKITKKTKIKIGILTITFITTILLLTIILIATIIQTGNNTNWTFKIKNSTPTTINNNNYNNHIQTNNTNQTITKTANEIMPTLKEIPTEFKIKTENTDFNKTLGITSKKKLSLVKITNEYKINQKYYDQINYYIPPEYYGTIEYYNPPEYGAIFINITTYSFTTTQQAKQYYTNKTNKIKKERGYIETKFHTKSNCFAYKQNYGFDARFTTAICQNKNIIFELAGTNNKSLENLDNYIQKFITTIDKKLE